MRRFLSLTLSLLPLMAACTAEIAEQPGQLYSTRLTASIEDVRTRTQTVSGEEGAIKVL